MRVIYCRTITYDKRVYQLMSGVHVRVYPCKLMRQRGANVFWRASENKNLEYSNITGELARRRWRRNVNTRV